MSRVDMVCPVCGRAFYLDTSVVAKIQKHTSGAILCSRPCVELVESIGDRARSAGALYEAVVRRGPEAGTHRAVKHRRKATESH